MTLVELIQEYTPLFPFYVYKTSDSLLEFRFEDRDSQTFLEIQIPKTGAEIRVSEFDLNAFRNHGAAQNIYILPRFSSDRNPSWWFQNQNKTGSEYRAK